MNLDRDGIMIICVISDSIFFPRSVFSCTHGSYENQALSGVGIAVKKTVITSNLSWYTPSLMCINMPKIGKAAHCSKFAQGCKAPVGLAFLGQDLV